VGEGVLRTRFFDDYLLAATAAGCQQVVLLAAGLDTCTFRLAWPDRVRLFEFDLPEMLAFKEQVLAAQALRRAASAPWLQPTSARTGRRR
jgi:methyltransferase (TIGR00027 family)